MHDESPYLAWRALLLAGVLLAVTSLPAAAQWTPLQVSANAPILDEFSKHLDGNNVTAPAYGNDHVEGDIIQVLTAEYGVFPPNADGSAHFANTVLFTARIGQGISGRYVDPAKLFAMVTPRPNEQTVFVRIFNASSLQDASFYTDTPTHYVSKFQDDVFVIDHAKTDQPLDANDDDNDGLHNSWEKSYGSDSNSDDSDSDGMSDYEEHLAGTDPTDRNSTFVVARLTASGGQLQIEWDSIPGKPYLVEYSADALTASPIFIPLFDEPMTAVDTVTQYPITNGLEGVQTSYRIRLVVN